MGFSEGPIQNEFYACKWITTFLGPKWHFLNLAAHPVGCDSPLQIVMAVLALQI